MQTRKRREKSRAQVELELERLKNDYRQLQDVANQYLILAKQCYRRLMRISEIPDGDHTVKKDTYKTEKDPNNTFYRLTFDIEGKKLEIEIDELDRKEDPNKPPKETPEEQA